jgi:PPK2 family polyphosphate:nucleotide phosphotransferase
MAKLKDFDFLRISPGKSIKLAHIAADSSKGVPEREEADAHTQKSVEKIGQLQDALYAEGRQSLLVVLQGLDGSGKDGTVRRVFSAINPTGVQVSSFKQPTAEELRHDFLWRCHNKVPQRGFIGVFNRSYYEDVLVVRVHADTLLAPELRKNKDEWDTRYRIICNFEKQLRDANTRIIKFFLHISREEQHQRFVSRQKDPAKNWKLEDSDFHERKFWGDYQHAYEKMLPATSTDHAPWYIIPADHKWVRNFYISHLLAATLRDMNPVIPLIKDPALITRRFK